MLIWSELLVVSLVFASECGICCSSCGWHGLHCHMCCIPSCSLLCLVEYWMSGVLEVVVLLVVSQLVCKGLGMFLRLL